MFPGSNRDYLAISEKLELGWFQKILEGVRRDESDQYPDGPPFNFQEEWFNRLNSFLEVQKRAMAGYGRNWCKEWKQFKQKKPSLL